MKKYTQTGIFSIIIMLPILIFSLVMIVLNADEDFAQTIVFVFLAVVFLICLLIFYKLTISIDDKFVSFSLGIGIIRKKYPVDQIRSCKTVRNSALMGIGIKLIQNGWLYNVSGLSAIELSFKNSRSIVRIGTDQPEVIAQEINRLINSESNNSEHLPKEMDGYYVSLLIFFLALALPAILIIYGNKEPKIDLAQNNMSISGMYGMKINYSEITVLDTVEYFPAIKMRTNGYAFGKTLKGNFRINDNKKIKLYIKKGNPPYIHIVHNGLDIYLNYADKKNTRSLYEKLNNKLNK